MLKRKVAFIISCVLIVFFFLATNVQSAEIHEAVKSGNLERVKQLLKSNPVLIEAKGEDDMTPLHFAAKHGNKNIVEFLLQKGAKLDSVDEDGCTALHFAVKGGNKDVVIFLLQKGAKTSVKNEKGETPLAMARRKGYQEIEKILQNPQAVKTSAPMPRKTPTTSITSPTPPPKKTESTVTTSPTPLPKTPEPKPLPILPPLYVEWLKWLIGMMVVVASWFLIPKIQDRTILRFNVVDNQDQIEIKITNDGRKGTTIDKCFIRVSDANEVRDIEVAASIKERSELLLTQGKSITFYVTEVDVKKHNLNCHNLITYTVDTIGRKYWNYAPNTKEYKEKITVTKKPKAF